MVKCILSFQETHLFVKFLFIVPFYRQFRLCITNASGKAHIPKEERAHPKALPLGERVLCAQLSPLRRLRRHLSRRERHFANLIITQIGRENNVPAEICPCVRTGGVSPPVFIVENRMFAREETPPLQFGYSNILMRTSLSLPLLFQDFFLMMLRTLITVGLRTILNAISKRKLPPTRPTII